MVLLVLIFFPFWFYFVFSEGSILEKGKFAPAQTRIAAPLFAPATIDRLPRDLRLFHFLQIQVTSFLFHLSN